MNMSRVMIYAMTNAPTGRNSKNCFMVVTIGSPGSRREQWFRPTVRVGDRHRYDVVAILTQLLKLRVRLYRAEVCLPGLAPRTAVGGAGASGVGLLASIPGIRRPDW